MGAAPEDLLEEGEGEAELTKYRSASADEWDDEPVQRASLAIAAPAHRDHIKEHLGEVLAAVRSMEDKSEELLEVR